MSWLDDAVNAVSKNLSPENYVKLQKQVQSGKSYLNKMKTELSSLSEGSFGGGMESRQPLHSNIPYYNSELAFASSQKTMEDVRVVETEEATYVRPMEAKRENRTTEAQWSKSESWEGEERAFAYSIRLNKSKGELRLPKDATKEEIRAAVMKDSGLTIQAETAHEKTSLPEGTAFRGFNSYASLFLKF